MNNTLLQQRRFSTVILFQIILTLCLFLPGLSGFAQHILTGKIVDEEKNPVPFVTVVIHTADSNSPLKNGALTDLNGGFKITGIRPGKSILTASSVGYLSITQEVIFDKLTEQKLPALVLKTDRQQLTGVTITASKPLIQQKTDRTIMNVGGSVLASGNNLYGILAMAPSVELINGSLTMNGKSNVLIMLNGKKIPNTTLENLLAAIPGEQIDRIEFIHHPSAKYDASASGGVIEIYTKRKTTLGWVANVSGNMSQGLRTGGGANGDFSLSTPKIDWNISGSYSQRGQIERGYTDRELYQGKTHIGNFHQDIDLSDGQMKSKDLNSSLNYQLSKTEVVGADLNIVSANLNGLGTINARINENNQLSNSQTLNNAFIEINLANYNLFYKKNLDTLGSNLMLSANYALYTSKQQQIFNQHTTGADGADTNYQFRNDAPATYHIYTGTADYTKVAAKALKIETGLKYTLTKNNSHQQAEILEDGKWVPQNQGPSSLGYQENIYAGYINLNQKLGKFSFQAGLRAEQSAYKVVGGIDSSYFNLFPNLRADYQITSDYSSSIAYAKNINRPSYESLIPYELFINNYTSVKGNAFLKPEYAHTFSFDQLYKKYSLNIAYTRTNHAISSVLLYNEQNLKFTETQENLMAQELFSAAVSVPVKITSWWSMNNRASVYNRVVKLPVAFKQDEFERRSKANVVLNTLNSFKFNKGYSAEVSAYYSSASIYSIYSMSAYSNVSAGIRKSLFKEKAFIKLDVSDIFYQNYRIATTTSVPLITAGMTKNDTRQLRLSFRYTFDKNTTIRREAVKSNGNSTELNRLNL